MAAVFWWQGRAEPDDSFWPERLRRPEIIDGVIQGSNVRLVTKEGSGRRRRAIWASAGALVKPAPPRFEDAFVDLLGGSAKEASPLSGTPHQPGRDEVSGRAGGEADQEIREFHGRRPDQLSHRSRRDLRPLGPQRRRQVDDIQDDVRLVAADRRPCPRGRTRPLRGRGPRHVLAWATWPRSSRSTAT